MEWVHGQEQASPHTGKHKQITPQSPFLWKAVQIQGSAVRRDITKQTEAVFAPPWNMSNTRLQEGLL